MTQTDTTYVDLQRAVERVDIDDYDHVIGVGWGPKRSRGEVTDDLAVVFLVPQKCDTEECEHPIPETVSVNGNVYPTDVQETGSEPRTLVARAGDAGWSDPWSDSSPLDANDRTSRVRPVEAGYSGGHGAISAGTIGSPPLETEDGTPVVLTNAHVAAPVGVAEVGDSFYQPGPRDNALDGDEPIPDDVIGALHDFADITPGGVNRSDSAVVEIDPELVEEGSILDLPDLQGFVTDPPLDATFTKSGRTTGVTEGTLRIRNVTITVRGYGDNGDTATLFENVDVLGPVSEPGDSGSLLGIEREDGFYGTHLLYAGSPYKTLAIPIKTVFDVHGRLTVRSTDGDGDE